MLGKTRECIDRYIETRYEGELIGISDLANFCNQPEWSIYLSLKKLAEQKKIEIVTRFFCPESHRIPNDRAPYCPICDLKYSSTDIVVAVYVNPEIKNELKPS